jgi:uncharacterized membrane protein YkoI
MSTKAKRILIATVALVALALGGAAVAGATGGEDNEKPITGNALHRASRAALQQAGGGRVSATEVGDEEGYYEVEVTRDDGSQVDVHLDRDLHVIGASADRQDGDETQGEGR